MTYVRRYLSLQLNHNLFFQHAKRKRHWRVLLMPLLLMAWIKAYADYRSLPCPEERQSADRSFQRIENEWPTRGSGDPVTQYIQQLGLRLAKLSQDGRNIFWHFSVVRNLAPNAFSIGNGYVFVTEGAVNLAQNESELAAILAHELGHELAGHFCKESHSNFSFGLFDSFSNPQTQPYRAGIGSMTQTIDPVKEQQADQIALLILQAGGFNPHAMLAISSRLPPGNPGHFTDVMRLQSLARATASMPQQFVKNSADFQNIKQFLSGR
jgi:Zn-dependent protease with chaperone function